MPVVTDDQIISLHTARGAQVYQFLPEHYADSSWTRDQRDASRCDLVLPPQPGLESLPDIVPWLHWVSVFDGERDVLLWKGPIQKASFNRKGLTLAVKDPAAYLSRTRNPMTKRWDAADPATVAGELWRAMIDVQGLGGHPLVRTDPEGDRYDFQTITDEKMLDQTIGDLVNLGLRWTVVSGAVILGPLSLEPVASLHEDDFIGGDGITLVRDGAEVFNDVLVRGPDNLARERVAFYGQNLQTIANVDSMFGVSNVQRAAQQMLRSTASVRTRLELGNAVLHPDAPVHIDELMPSARFIIEAHGIRQLVELTGVEVTRRAGMSTVSVTMDSIEEDIELLDQKQGPTMTLGGQAL